jgi:hypothetical protein
VNPIRTKLHISNSPVVGGRKITATGISPLLGPIAKWHTSILATAAAILCLLGDSARADMIIAGYTDVANDRFTNDQAFIMASFDLSGVGRTAGSRWATAISRNVIISATHYPPSGTVSFYTSNDPTTAPVTRDIVSTMAIVGTDLFLGVLGQNLPAAITHYAFAMEALSGRPATNTAIFLENAGSYQDANAYSFGLSTYDVGSDPNRSTMNDQAVGRNRVSAYSENVAFNANLDNDSLLFLQDAAGAAGFVTHEAGFKVGDSGAPTFVDVEGNLVLLGTKAFTLSDDPVTFTYNGINYTGNQAATIQGFINTSAVPEASSHLSMALVLLLMTARRRPNSRDLS